VETNGRHGTVVLEGVGGAAVSSADLDAAAQALAVVARQLGIAPDAAHVALDRALRDL